MKSKNSVKTITVAHLYPKEMNIYGDLGNVIALKNRLEQRGYVFNYEVIGLKTKRFKPADIYFMGGGQDNDMFKVCDDLLLNKADFIKQEVETNKVFLLICGAFQLFGKSFIDGVGKSIEGLGILPVETRAPGNSLEDRCLGNLLTEINPDIAAEIRKAYDNSLPSNTIVGFENHSGQTYFTDDTISPLAKVIIGKGNNAEQKIEGARYKNVFASYSHGSLLPKNPHLADLILYIAIKNKYGIDFEFPKLDDKIEWLAHQSIRDRLIK